MIEAFYRFVDWMAWRCKAWGAESAAEADAKFWDRSAAYCHKRANEARTRAWFIREAKLRRRFGHPRGIGE